MRVISSFVHLDAIRANATRICARTGVDLIGVLKADAYGLGAVRVAETIADLVSGWYVFAPSEAISNQIWELTRKPTLAAVPGPDDSARALEKNCVRPAVWTRDAARKFRRARPVLSVDTGMQRFSCSPGRIESVLSAAPEIDEAFTHAPGPQAAHELHSLLGERGLRLHAAGSALLDDPTCLLDAVRPGLALFRDAARVVTRLADVRQTVGPLGYGALRSKRHGIILAGYSQRLRRGPCIVNNRRQRIVEVGMQSALLTVHEGDKTGDEVILLDKELTPEEVANEWEVTPHEALLTLVSMGERCYFS